MLVGTAGIPYSTKGAGSANGIARCRELNLGAMEVEFVRGVKMGEATAREVKVAAEKNNIKLTVHAPYYINLTSKDKGKLEASKIHILRSAHIGNICGAKSIAFHPAYYSGEDINIVYDKVRLALKEIVEKLKEKKNKIILAPETTGKISQFGTLKELLELSKELPQVQPCIDFAHLHARTGKINSEEEFESILHDIKVASGADAIKKLHIHLSGIVYGAKGEKHHVFLPQSDLNWKTLLQVLHKRADGIIIAESPIPEKDALLIQKYLESL